MAITIGAVATGQTNGGVSTVTSGSVTTQSGSVIMVGCVWDGSSTTFNTISDSKGNTWTQLGTEAVVSSSLNADCRWYYAQNVTGGTSHTFTFTTTGTASLTLVAIELRGVPTTGALDLFVTGTTDTSSPYTTSITPTSGDRTLVAIYFGDGLNSAPVVGGSWTTPSGGALAGDANSWGVGSGTIDVTANGSTAYTASFTEAGSASGVVGVAAFIPLVSAPVFDSAVFDSAVFDTGAPSNDRTGTLSVTLGAATLSGSGTVVSNNRTGTLSVTLGAVTLSGSGTVVSNNRTGTLSVTLGAATLSASGTVVSNDRTGSLSVTLGDLTLSATGAFATPVDGTLERTLFDTTLDAQAFFGSNISGSLSATLGAIGIEAVGSAITVTGSLSQTLGECVVSESFGYDDFIDPDVVRSVGAFTSGTGALTVAMPVGWTVGDYLLMFVETANQAVTAPTGWTAVGTVQGTGTAGGTTATRLTVFGRFAVAGLTTVSVADPGDHAAARILSFTSISSAQPLDVTPVYSVAATATTTVSFPAVTTVTDGAQIIHAVANATDTATSQGSDTITNALLAELVAVTGTSSTTTTTGTSNTVSGNGGGFSIYSGVLAKAGPTGTTSTTLTTASVQSRITIALRQTVSVPVIGTLNKTLDSLAINTLAFTPRSGSLIKTLDGLTTNLAGIVEPTDLFRHSSSPGLFNINENGSGVGTGTSASFTPPAGTWVYLTATWNTNTTGTHTVTPSSTGGGLSAWTQVIYYKQASGQGAVSVHRAYVNTSVPTTVSVTGSGSAATASSPASAGFVDVWKNAATDQSTATTVTGNSTTQTINPTLTTSRANSRVVGVGVDWNTSGTPSSTDVYISSTAAGGTTDRVTSIRAYKAANTPTQSTSVAINMNAGAANPVWSYGLYEVLSPGASNITGTLVASESAVDTLSATGDVLVRGTLTASETGADTFTATGVVPISGLLASTEQAVDSIQITGTSAFILSSSQALLLYQVCELHGLINPLQVTPTSRSAGDIVQTVSESSGTVTITTTTAPTIPTVDPGTLSEELAALHGLTAPLVVTATSRTAGSISQTLNDSGGVTTVTRV